MRLDLFLKVSRLVLRRTLAQDLCDAGKVKINGKMQKASREVKVDAEIKFCVSKFYKCLILNKFHAQMQTLFTKFYPKSF
jgi:ribosomal 50S subunit-recycling heat shock protein